MNQACVDWRLDNADTHTVRRTAEIICDSLQNLGFVSAEPLPSALNGDCLQNPVGTWHHMGTTRMGSNAKTSVVDADCKVYGTHNLFVAGSSVFPTAGHHCPTFTILTLAARLAKHVVATLEEVGVENAPSIAGPRPDAGETEIVAAD